MVCKCGKFHGKINRCKRLTDTFLRDLLIFFTGDNHADMTILKNVRKKNDAVTLKNLPRKLNRARTYPAVNTK